MLKKIITAGLLGLVSITAQAQYKCDQMIQKTGFEICYNYQLKAPLWSKMVLTKAHINSKVASRKGKRFYEEKSIPRKYRATLADFKTKNTPKPFDRGHTISAADVTYNSRAMKDSFSLANITAQTPESNRGIYKYTEILTRKLASRAGKANLVAGAVFDQINPKRVGPGRIAVPTYLYRVVYSGNSEKYAFLIPNIRKNLGKKPSKYRVSIQKLEKLTGFRF